MRKPTEIKVVKINKDSFLYNPKPRIPTIFENLESMYPLYCCKLPDIQICDDKYIKNKLLNVDPISYNAVHRNNAYLCSNIISWIHNGVVCTDHNKFLTDASKMSLNGDEVINGVTYLFEGIDVYELSSINLSSPGAFSCSDKSAFLRSCLKQINMEYEDILDCIIYLDVFCDEKLSDRVCNYMTLKVVIPDIYQNKHYISKHHPEIKY